MKKLLIILFLININTANASEIVCFSPNGNCTNLIITEINNSKEIILVQAYSFTSKPIGSALLDASKRGIEVRVIFDKRQKSANYSLYNFFVNAKMPITSIDSNHAAAHNKIIIIDNKVLITGSFNFTASAEYRNAENLLIIKDNPNLVNLYIENFYIHQFHSTIGKINYDRH